jgi:hypothetical protein
MSRVEEWQERRRRAEIRNEIGRDRLLRASTPRRLVAAALGRFLLGVGEGAVLLGIAYVWLDHIAHRHHVTLQAIPALWSMRWTLGVVGLLGSGLLTLSAWWLLRARPLLRFAQHPDE